MISILDRYILKSLIFNYVVALTVMIGLYVIMDLFVNLDEFTELRPGTLALLSHIVDYYAPNLLLYFSQLSGVIALFACVLTLVWMRHFNELTAVLSSGVSLYRVAAPIILFGVVTTGLLIVDTEWLIPQVAHRLARRHDEVGTGKGYAVALMRDQSGALVSAAEFQPATGELRRPVTVTRDAEGSLWKIVEADSARWESVPGHPHGGQWALSRGKELTRSSDSAVKIGPQTKKITNVKTHIDTSLDPAAIQLRQSEQWIKYLSLSQLKDLEDSHPPNLAQVQQTRHVRIATPIINLVMLLLGLPFFLDRSPINIARDATWCMAVTGLCFVATFTSQSILPQSNSALPAWLPIILFGPTAVVLLDRVKT